MVVVYTRPKIALPETPSYMPILLEDEHDVASLNDGGTECIVR